MSGVKAWHADTQLVMHTCRLSSTEPSTPAAGSPTQLPLQGAGLALGPHHQLQWLACVCLRVSLTDAHPSQWGNCYPRLSLSQECHQPNSGPGVKSTVSVEITCILSLARVYSLTSFHIKKKNTLYLKHVKEVITKSHKNNK